MKCLIILFYFRFANGSCPDLVGPLAINDLLKRGQRLFENEVLAPEALTEDNEGLKMLQYYNIMFCLSWLSLNAWASSHIETQERHFTTNNSNLNLIYFIRL